MLLSLLVFGQQSQAFEVKDSSALQFSRHLVYGWYVEVSDSSGAVTLSEASNKALLYHNALSVYSHARSLETSGVSLRYVNDKLAKNHVGLVAGKPMSVTQAQEKAAAIGATPQSKRVIFEPSVVPYFFVDEFSPNDQCYLYQGYLGTNSRFLDSVEANYLWPNVAGGETDYSERAAIAVLDTGIVKHDDFGARQRILGWDYISNTSQSDDGDGRDDSPIDPGFDATCTSGSGFHGTHVASIATAEGNNGIGITGLSWKSPIVALRVIGIRDGSPGDILAALQALPSFSEQVDSFFGDSSIRVANMSLGVNMPLTCGNAFSSSTFATELLGDNILTVAAAGNNHADTNDYAPANCPDVISVMAINHQGGKAYYSNYGPEVDIAAPGGEFDSNGNNSYGVLALINSNRYDYKQGTSMAAPMVSGIAAQLAGYEPSLSATEIRNILLATSYEYINNNTFGLKCDTFICGSGVVNGQDALEHLISGLRYVFFPRQITYLPKGTAGEIDVHMTRVSDTDIDFRLLVHSDSCQLTTSSYPVFTIPAGELSASFGGEDALQLADDGCNNVSYEISLKDANGVALNPPESDVLLVKDYNRYEGALSDESTSPNNDFRYSGNTRHTFRVIRKNEYNFNPQVRINEASWEYLPASSSGGNTHNVYLSQPGVFYMSTISDMDSEIRISKASSGDVLYNSQTADPANNNRADTFIKFSIDRAQSILVNVRERFPSSGQGGMYALTVTPIPTFNSWDGFTESYCQVELGVDEGVCSTTSLSEDGNSETPRSQLGSSSLELFSLLGLLMIALLVQYQRTAHMGKSRHHRCLVR